MKQLAISLTVAISIVGFVGSCWDEMKPTPEEFEEKWTSIRVSPQQVIELGRVHGALNAAFGASRSQSFSLALALLKDFLEHQSLQGTEMTLAEVRVYMLEKIG